MKTIAAICFALLTGRFSHAQDRTGVAHTPATFVGAWRLARLERPGPGGNIQPVDCSGLFVFTPDGHASVQVMERRPHTPDTASPQPYSTTGYEASWGTYKVDATTHTFTFHIQGALVRSLIGQDLLRSYQFSGKKLIVTSTRPEEHWRVIWERSE